MTVASNWLPDGGPVVGPRDHVAAADVDLVGQRERHRLPGDGELEIAVVGHDPRDLAGLAGRQGDDLVARRDRAPGDRPRKPAEIEVRAVHPLDGQPERRELHALVVDLDRLEVGEQRRSVVPGHLVALLDDVRARQAGQRDAGDVLDADLAGERPVRLLDLAEALLRVVDEVHLVDRDGDVPDPDQRDQVAVAPRLRQHALARVDQHHGAVGRRGARDHVAGVLLVSRGVGDDELPAIGREVAVRDVDRDALLPLGGEAVEQQREVEVVALGAEPPGLALESREVVLEQHLRLEQEASDQRALAVVDAAARDEAHHALVLVRLQVREDVLGDHVRHVGH